MSLFISASCPGRLMRISPVGEQPITCAINVPFLIRGKPMKNNDNARQGGEQNQPAGGGFGPVHDFGRPKSESKAARQASCHLHYHLRLERKKRPRRVVSRRGQRVQKTTMDISEEGASLPSKSAPIVPIAVPVEPTISIEIRSEERRVGKEGRSRFAP